MRRLTQNFLTIYAGAPVTSIYPCDTGRIILTLVEPWVTWVKGYIAVHPCEEGLAVTPEPVRSVETDGAILTRVRVAFINVLIASGSYPTRRTDTSGEEKKIKIHSYV